MKFCLYKVKSLFLVKKTVCVCVCVCVFLYSLCIYSLLPLYVKDYAFWSTFCLTADTVPDYIYFIKFKIYA